MSAPVVLETDSLQVYRVAARLWSAYPAGTLASPVTIRISVVRGESPRFETPRYETHGHRVTIRVSPRDVAVADSETRSGYAVITSGLADSDSALAYHIIEPLTYILVNCAHFLPIHSSCVAVDGRAAVLCGGSGAGKTSFAYHCARRGWHFVSGDATHLVRTSEPLRVIGRPYEIRFRGDAASIFPELTSFPLGLRPNGKLDYEIDTRALPIARALDAEPVCLVHLDRRPGCSTSLLSAIESDSFLPSLEENIKYGGNRTRREQRRALYRLLRLPAYRLTYADPDEAQSLLLSAVRH